jgi:phosphoglycolate phosphatase
MEPGGVAPFGGLIFDLDGTLLDTLLDLAESVNDVLRHSGFPEHRVDDYRMYVGEGARVLVTRALPPGTRTETVIESTLRQFGAQYDRRWDRHTKPYPGIDGLLGALNDAGIPFGVLSNKPDRFVRLCVERFFPERKFRSVRGQIDGVPRKPDPAGALLVAGELAVPPGRVLYAGDSSVDMTTALAAGMFPVGVTWGFRTRDELLQSGARLLVDTPAQILPLIGRE